MAENGQNGHFWQKRGSKKVVKKVVKNVLWNDDFPGFALSRQTRKGGSSG